MSSHHDHCSRRVHHHHTGRGGATATGARTPTSLRGELADATGYLFLDHIPFTVLSITVLLPLVVGFGGAMSSVGSFWVFAVLALLPAVCMAVLLGWLVHQIFVESCRGIIDPPTISRSPQVLRNAGSFLSIASICALVLLVPGILATRYLGAAGAGILAGGALMFPFATVLCLSRNDLRGLHPAILLPALGRLRGLGLAVTILTWAMFSPAILAYFWTSGCVEFLRLSLCAAVSVAPMVITARFMGNIMHGNKHRLADLLSSCSSTLGTEYDPSVEIYSAAHFDDEPQHIRWEDWSVAQRAEPRRGPSAWSESGILATALARFRARRVEAVPQPPARPRVHPDLRAPRGAGCSAPTAR